MNGNGLTAAQSQAHFEGVKSDFLSAISAQPTLDFKIINRALEFATGAHSGQIRNSGELYITHPIAVAQILIDLKLDTNSIVAALLHDVVEDTDILIDEIEKNFGNDVGKLVFGLTKLAKIAYQPTHIRQAEDFGKLLVAMSEDIRVLLIKLADRLHNMRTLSAVKNIDKQKRTAYETIEIYAPLAEKIGLHNMQNEMQDLAFAALYPDIRNSILGRLSFLKTKGAALVEDIKKEIKELLQNYNINAEVSGREKTCYSIWRKMENKKISFEQLADIMAFRIIVSDEIECYRVLGIIHTSYKCIPYGFKDYISNKKQNGYQSLHTTVIGPKNNCIEIQIRTAEMHNIAEYGVAAHWSYKHNSGVITEKLHFQWIHELLEILRHTSNLGEFLENTKLNMYKDQVFCFSPQGTLVALPKNATPVDFAFAIHSDIGLSCIGAKVNNKAVPLNSFLENGDQVEIIRGEKLAPSQSWVNFVATGRARSAIRKFIKQNQIAEFINLGRVILFNTLKSVDIPYNEHEFSKILPILKKNSIDDLLFAVGNGMLNAQDIIMAMDAYKNGFKEQSNPLTFFAKLGIRKLGITKKIQQSLPIEGLIAGMTARFANCCNPLHGDRIVGIITEGSGLMVHIVDCKVLDHYIQMPEKWVGLSWSDAGNLEFISRLNVAVTNKQGSLAEVTKVIAQMSSNITNIKVKSRSQNFFEFLIDLEIENLEQLQHIISSLRSLECVYSVSRVMGY
ncbi:bifunctional (p)ppGpp synthetase/guanosine-3',5'-bis(diphosphate) 3'-pyrophosphohydrolase [Candidatus Lariskella endosymbiont of Epinotia ramella]|uniref:RelA/SpoT family protein n=1 Tax=Candidatus Lariskella endosymbiont of Epinotia ramella TaxID=3066224 RepID=UPI0030D36640